MRNPKFTDTFEILRNDVDLDRLNGKWLDDSGNPRVLPASDYMSEGLTALRVWCHKNAVYQVPTVELVDWLSKFGGAGRVAIEIGAGNGVISKAIAFRPTDSKIQNTPKVKEFYAMVGQPTINYPPYVEKFEARQVVEKYRPDVVLGCWVTQVGNEEGISSMTGVDEEWLVQNVKTYIVIGNELIHGAKRIMNLSHETIRKPWIVSRSKFQELNRIWIWGA